jgi:hypothetical protein
MKATNPENTSYEGDSTPVFERVVAILEQARSNVVRSVNSQREEKRRPAGDEFASFENHYPVNTPPILEFLDLPGGHGMGKTETRHTTSALHDAF